MRSCSICEKGYKKSYSKSHSQQRAIRKLGANLQWLKLPSGQRLRACTKCIRSYSGGKLKLAELV